RPAYQRPDGCVCLSDCSCWAYFCSRRSEKSYLVQDFSLCTTTHLDIFHSNDFNNNRHHPRSIAIVCFCICLYFAVWPFIIVIVRKRSGNIETWFQSAYYVFCWNTRRYHWWTDCTSYFPTNAAGDGLDRRGCTGW